ncbi:hypothetical protein ACFLY6_02545 [Candidatus Dependentiae bacterium]
MWKVCSEVIILSGFILVFHARAFVEGPEPIFKSIEKLQRHVCASCVRDESSKVAQIVFSSPGVAVVKFVHSEKEGFPTLIDDSDSLPLDLQGKVRLYQVNAARCMDFLKTIAVRVKLSKLDLPAIMFFNGSSLSLPIEQGDMPQNPLYDLIRSRTGRVKK